MQILLLSSLATTATLTARSMGGESTTNLALSATALGLILTMTILIARISIRAAQGEIWIRKMGMGDLEYRVETRGNDEITKAMESLETLRQATVRASRTGEVERLSGEVQTKNQEMEEMLEELHRTQDQVISRQKLAELGELTAGVAHEIRNPLNLMQNFARASDEMIAELKDVLGQLKGPPTREQQETIEELSGGISENMERMQRHGRRANRIVLDMLSTSRASKGKFQTVNINELVELHAMLAYHSARSHDPEFNVKIVREFDPEVGEASVVPEDIARVILNLAGNACYATAERTKADEPGYQPTMWIGTSKDDEWVEINIKDNGSGIPEDVMEKIFNPFFTTKPSDQGTGLGLSLSNDIVKEHGGTILPESKVGEYARFTVRMPRTQENGEKPTSP